MLMMNGKCIQIRTRVMEWSFFPPGRLIGCRMPVAQRSCSSILSGRDVLQEVLYSIDLLFHPLVQWPGILHSKGLVVGSPVLTKFKKVDQIINAQRPPEKFSFDVLARRAISITKLHINVLGG